MAEEKKSFGNFLVARGIITADQLKKAVQELKRGGERLEQAIVRLKFAKEELILQCLADYFNLPYVDLNTYLIDEDVIKIISEEVARRYTLIPLFKIGNTLTVAMVNPLDIHALDEVRNKTRTDVEIAISTEEKIKKAIDQHYGFTGTMLETTFQQFVGGDVGGASRESSDYRKTYDLAVKEPLPAQMEDAPASRLFDLVMIQAIRDRASDIHFEPDERALRVRSRIDGFLYEILSLPKAIHPSLVSRVKVLAEMDIAETRLP